MSNDDATSVSDNHETGKRNNEDALKKLKKERKDIEQDLAPTGDEASGFGVDKASRNVRLAKPSSLQRLDVTRGLGVEALFKLPKIEILLGCLSVNK